MKIFVVFGSTGEYSDRSEWPVIAYTKESDAKHHVEKATEYAEAWHAHTKEAGFGWYEEREKEKTANPMDPQFSCDYTGTEYWFAEVELREQFTAPEVSQ